MRAVLVREYGPAERAAVEEVTEPLPGAGEVVIDVEFADVSYPDLLMIEGRYQVKPPLPFVPGKVAAGRISGIGPGVSGFGTGDRVLAFVEHGAHAERMRAPAANCHAIPPGIGASEAAALGMAYQTAHFALRRRARMRQGETVLVLGAGGGVGLAAIELAKAFGSGAVVAATRGEAKRAAVLKAGADHVVDADAADLHESLRREVLAATGGRGADVVIDPVGGRVHAAALRAVAWEGRLVVVGFVGGDIPAIRANYLLVKNIAALGLQLSDYRDRRPDLCRAAQAEVFALCAAGRLRPRVARTLPLEDFRELLRLLAEAAVSGKLLIDPRR
jgi:NADPH2:quinone reductase